MLSKSTIMEISQWLPFKFKIKCTVLLILTLAGVETPLSAQENSGMSWRDAQRQENSWYASEEAQRIANNVLLYQNENGGWLKNIDMAENLSQAEVEKLQKLKSQKSGTTIDNGATFTQMQYLAKVYTATGKERYKEAFLKGVDYLLAAQYENGGWPQFYPLKKGYYEHITFNDDAMIGVMDLLRDVTRQKAPYDFVDAGRQKKARAAIEKGLEVILKTQVEVNGKPTVWSAQHDKNTLKPAKARDYELPSLSGKESVGIVKYLMDIEDPGEEVKSSIQNAIGWFKESEISGLKVETVRDESLPKGRDRIVVKDSNAGPLWARFYEIEANKPMFVGRDGKVKENLEEIEHERRVGYSYLGNYAETLLEKDHPEWEKKHG